MCSTGAVEKSISSGEYSRLTDLLRTVRTDAGLRQADVAAALGEQQSFVSKYECGERRLDLVELSNVADALGTDLLALVKRFVDRR
jgi:transcriptional regulator with XRE-family HTH domain